jgi:thioredoxin reductase (NADPH)
VGLNQIAVATGQAARAAVRIHNQLPPALRPPCRHLEAAPGTSA